MMGCAMTDAKPDTKPIVNTTSIVNARRDGFSLVEVVVTMVIVAVVVLSLGMLTTLTAQRSIDLANGTGRQAITLQEINRIASMPYDTIPNKVGCRTFSNGQLSYTRCISYTQGTRYRQVTLVVTPTRAGTFADTVKVRRVVSATPNPLGP
jgi:prepilin-type N-terminal cleavage/methylation domain-containing protein